MTGDGVSRPDEDRRLAATARHGPRRAAGLKDLVESYLKSPAAKRAKRFGKVLAALDTVLDESRRERVVPVAWRKDSLTLEVDNAPLLAELKQFQRQAIVAALVATGTGITKVVFRMKRAKQLRDAKHS